MHGTLATVIVLLVLCASAYVLSISALALIFHCISRHPTAAWRAEMAHQGIVIGIEMATKIPRADLRAVQKDWPRATPDEARVCREGGRHCPRCTAMLTTGVNPYTLEPLGSARQSPSLND